MLIQELPCRFKNSHADSRTPMLIQALRPSDGTIPDDFLDQLESVEQESKSAKQTADKATSKISELQQGHSKIQGDLRCIKFEVKKLKENPPAAEPVPVQERAAPTPAAVPDEFPDRLENVENRANEAHSKATQPKLVIRHSILNLRLTKLFSRLAISNMTSTA